MQSDLFIYLFFSLNAETLDTFSEESGGETVKSPGGKKKKKKKSRLQEQISQVCEEIKVQAKTCLLKIPLTDRLPEQNLRRSAPSNICLSFHSDTREENAKGTQKEPSRELLSTSLVLCRSYSLSRIPRFLFIKKKEALFFQGAARERRVGRHKPHSKKNQNKILTDADQSSLPPLPHPSHLLPVHPPSSLSHTHKLTHTYWIKMGLVARCAMLSKTHKLKKNERKKNI